MSKEREVAVNDLVDKTCKRLQERLGPQCPVDSHTRAMIEAFSEGVADAIAAVSTAHGAHLGVQVKILMGFIEAIVDRLEALESQAGGQ